MEHVWGACRDDDCEDWQTDLEHGLIIACDECDRVGSNSYGYPEWQLQPDGQVLCESCADKTK